MVDPIVSCLTEHDTFCAWLYDHHLVICDLDGGHIELYNPSAAAIWLLLDELADIDALTQAYGDIFELGSEDAKQHILTCLKTWQLKGWAQEFDLGRWRIANESPESNNLSFSDIHAPVAHTPTEVSVSRQEGGVASTSALSEVTADRSDSSAERSAMVFDVEWMQVIHDNVAAKLEHDQHCLSLASFSGGLTTVHAQAYWFGDVPFRLTVYQSQGWEPTAFALSFCKRLLAVFQGFPAYDHDARTEGARSIAWVHTYLSPNGIVLADCVQANPREVGEELAMAMVYEACLRVSYPARRIVFALHAAGVECIGTGHSDCAIEDLTGVSLPVDEVTIKSPCEPGSSQNKEPSPVPLKTCPYHRSGHTVALAGVSGAGKSTLSAYLAQRGWRLLGDDIVAVALMQGESREVGLLPFPTGVSLKAGSWSVLRDMYPSLDQLPVISYASKEAKYVCAPFERREEVISGWDVIVLPRFVEGADCLLTRLSPAEALQGLLEAGLSLFDQPSIREVHAALVALSRLPTFSVQYGRIHEVEACLNELKAN